MVEALKERVCLVTGASRGIGRAITEALLQQGGIVYGTATTAAGAAAIDAECQAFGGRVYGRVLDVTDAKQVAGLVDEMTRTTAAPQILVNNAGITRDNLVLRMKVAEWDDIMATNLKAVYTLCKACLRGMTRARAGRIINMTSVVAATGNSGQANYAAAKAGLIGFSKSLAREVASRNITVNTIAPGFIATDMTSALSDEQRAALRQNIPLNRLGEPRDIAAAVVFLASEGASYITGETIHINGGMYMA